MIAATTIENLGTFTPYKPAADAYPAGFEGFHDAPFARNAAGQDFYDLVYRLTLPAEGETLVTFEAPDDSVYVSIDAAGRVVEAVRDGAVEGRYQPRRLGFSPPKMVRPLVPVEVEDDEGESDVDYVHGEPVAQSFTILRAHGLADGVKGGWTWDGALTFTDPAAVPTPANLLARAKRTRKATEMGGIIVNGIPVATDDRSKTLILGARRRAEKDITTVTPWAAEDGHVYPLGADAVLAISDAVGDHVDTCFQVFATVVVGIQGGSIATFAAVDAAFAAIDPVHQVAG